MANAKLDQNRNASILVKDTVSLAAAPASGILAGLVEGIAVAIIDGSGNQITSFGGGTQYTDGGTPPANPVGNTIEWNEGGTWRTVSTAKPLPIQIVSGNPTTIAVTQSTSPWVVSNSGTFAVQATLAAETTKVLGVVRTADGSGNLLTATANALDINVKTIAGSLTLGTVTTVSTVTNVSQNGGVAISLNAGATDTGTRRVVQANGAGKTIVSVGGSAASSGNNTLIAAGTNKLKVFAFSLSCVSTTSLLCIFQSGASGTELWRVRLQAATGTSTGANLSVEPPAWLFATASATLLNLNLSSAQAVDWSVSYYDEA